MRILRPHRLGLSLFPPRAHSPKHSLPFLRPFSSTPHRLLLSTELTPALLSSLRASPTRLWNDIHSTAQFGIGNAHGSHPHETGLNRLALTYEDKLARDWFAETTKNLGCKVFVDEIGNQFAVRPGLSSYPAGADGRREVNALSDADVLSVPATFAGSHLDSQPQGGRFDGVLGVCAGIEMLRVLEENWIETVGPVGVVNWTNEEGKRWKRSMMGSGVWADGSKEYLENVWALEDGKHSVKQQLGNHGYMGTVRASVKEGVRMAGHFEVHIEQAKRLESAGEKVAVVSGVQGYKWFTITFTGTEAHAGATPWEDRADPVLWASTAIKGIAKVVKGLGGLATVGCFDVKPGSVNVVAGEVTITLDVRHEGDEELQRIFKQVGFVLGGLKGAMQNDGKQCKVDMKLDFESKAMTFDPIAMSCVEESAKSVTGKEQVPRLVSGAGHDSVNTAKHCPTAMIFVPCKDGVTHNIREWCSEEDCAIGASVLLQSVLRFDQRRQTPGNLQGLSD
jgi:hydantoinase/carbamoylase family amidase